MCTGRKLTKKPISYILLILDRYAITMKNERFMPSFYIAEAKGSEKEYAISIAQPKPTIVFFSTYPPRECGIATFTQDLLQSSQKFLGPLVECKVAALNFSPLDTYKYPPEVEWKIDQNSKKDYKGLAKVFNKDEKISGIMIQHEYGIFGGEQGEFLLSFMENCTKQMLVTLHTVLPSPDAKMKDVTTKIIHYASTIIVLTYNSKRIIEELYPEAKGKVFMIPHGIHPVSFSTPKAYKTKLKLNRYTVITTFGLLSRGKGIEYVLRALPEVIKKYPSVMYLILGQTHPVIQRAEGEKYRHALAKLIQELGIEKHVKFYDQYFSLSDLFTFLKATDIYIATSTDPNQAVSGTFSYAMGTGRAVISTEFAQAKEIITSDTGRLVPIKNSSALTTAICDLLNDRDRLLKMGANAYVQTRPMLWSNVASEYLMLLQRMVVPILKLDHLTRMTDDFGLFQFAHLTTPNKEFGYTIDDNARALIFCSWYLKEQQSPEIEKLLTIYLYFLKKCQQPDGSFLNYIEYKNKLPTPQNTQEDLEDAQSRAMWALAEVLSNEKLPNSIRDMAKNLFVLKLQQPVSFTHLRAQAFAIKAITIALNYLPEKKLELIGVTEKYANILLTALTTHSVKSWRWFEDELNYNNAVLPESLLLAGNALDNTDYTQQGIAALEFLISKTFSTTYMPIGHSSWYKNNETRSNYDQQPEDPASMIIALSTAFAHTQNESYKKLANICFSWFLGNNSLKKSLYDVSTGGCYDGLHPNRVNLNEGAESLVSYLMSRLLISQLHE